MKGCERGRPLPDLPRVEVCGHLSSFLSRCSTPALSPPCAIINSSTLTTASASDVDVDASDLSYAWVEFCCVYPWHIYSGRFKFKSLPSILGRTTTLDVGKAFLGPFYFYFPLPLAVAAHKWPRSRCSGAEDKGKKLKLKLLLLSARCRSRSRSPKSQPYTGAFLFFPPPSLLMNALTRGSTPPALVRARLGGVGAFCA